MSDIADKAQALIDLQLQSNLNKVLLAQQPAPKMNKDGKRICVDCGEAIPAGRLLAMPRASRCIRCQTESE